MDRRTTSTIIIFSLLCSLVAGLQAVKVAEAYSLEPNPPPQITPPTILIDSPKNNSIISDSSIWLVFNVSGPESIEAKSNSLYNIYYQGDWQTEKQQLFYFNSSTDVETFNFLSYNITLSNIPQGTHQLQIYAQGAVGITRAMFGYLIPSETNATIIFTINPNQTTPLPTITLTATPSTLPTPTLNPSLTHSAIPTQSASPTTLPTQSSSSNPDLHQQQIDMLQTSLAIVTVAIAILLAVIVALMLKRRK